MDSTVLILAVLGAAMLAVIVLMAIGYSELWMEDDSDNRFVAEFKRALDGKLKNDQVEPEEDTYVSFEELLEKPKRKNDEKPKNDDDRAEQITDLLIQAVRSEMDRARYDAIPFAVHGKDTEVIQLEDKENERFSKLIEELLDQDIPPQPKAWK
jgi:hypothetical protein